VDVVPRYGINKQAALNDSAARITKAPSENDAPAYTEIWIDPPQPLSAFQMPTPFKKIGLATFANQDEVQDVKWKGRATFDDAGFTSLKPVKGAKAQFYVMQPPSDITFMNGADQNNTNIPIKHRSAPGGWTVPAVDLDTLVGLIPFVDHDTAVMVYPADKYTELLFKGSSAVKDLNDSLNRYAFGDIRFVSPSNVQMLQSFDEGDMPTPPAAKALENMTPKDWADLSLIVHGPAAQELVARMSRMGGIRVSPETMQQFLGMLPMDLTMAEVDALTKYQGKPGAPMSEAELLQRWSETLERMRGGGPANTSQTPVATSTGGGQTTAVANAPSTGTTSGSSADASYVVDQLKAYNWSGLKEGAYYKIENSSGGPVGHPEGTVLDCVCFILYKGSRQGMLVTLEVHKADGEFTPITVTAIRSPRYTIDGALVSDGKEQLGSRRIKPIKRDSASADTKTPPKKDKP
jgi:hypothetical protein